VYIYLILLYNKYISKSLKGLQLMNDRINDLDAAKAIFIEWENELEKKNTRASFLTWVENQLAIEEIK
jgi:hypothetical protein